MQLHNSHLALSVVARAAKSLAEKAVEYSGRIRALDDRRDAVGNGYDVRDRDSDSQDSGKKMS